MDEGRSELSSVPFSTRNHHGGNDVLGRIGAYRSEKNAPIRRISISDQFWHWTKTRENSNSTRARKLARNGRFYHHLSTHRRSIPSFFSITIDPLRPLCLCDKSNESKFLRDEILKDAFERLENTREALETDRGDWSKGDRSPLYLFPGSVISSPTLSASPIAERSFLFTAGDLIFPSLLFSALDAGRDAALLCSRFDDGVVVEHASPALALRKSNSVRSVCAYNILW